MLVLFGLTLFLSGALLFFVEPMFAKMALPELGGTPAVWNVCMVFYQALLLAGYVYAHQIAKRLRPRCATLLQMGIVVVALFALPVRLPEMMSSPLKQSPTLWLLALLSVGMGLPFLVLTTYSSTLQAWHASTSSRQMAEPYVLYSASNLGSMLGLFAYPLLLERYVGLAEQSRLWERGYVFLLMLTTGCALVVWFVPPVKRVHSNDEGEMALPATRLEQFKWLALSFIPSSLMLGVTTALTTELPPIPLLWVLPLAVYLLSFILVFARKPITYHHTIVETLPFLLLVVAFPIASKSVLSPILLVLFYLVTLFFACMACHGELAISRPPAARLTQFYLCLSAGGALGGFFNAILAPVIFNSVVELPLVVVFLALAILFIGSSKRRCELNKQDFLLPAALGIGVAIACVWFRSTGSEGTPMTSLAIFAAPLLLCFSFARRPLRFALGLARSFLRAAYIPANTGTCCSLSGASSASTE